MDNRKIPISQVRKNLIRKINNQLTEEYEFRTGFMMNQQRYVYFENPIFLDESSIFTKERPKHASDRVTMLSTILADPVYNQEEEFTYNVILAQKVNEAIDCLSPVGRTVVRLKFGINKQDRPYKEKEIGKVLGVNYRKINHLWEVAREELKSIINEKYGGWQNLLTD